jgi:hypothetical protein
MKKNQFPMRGRVKIYFQILLPLLFLFTGIDRVDSQQLASQPTYFDMGNDTSAVWDGFTRVTPSNLFTGQSSFGWQSGEGLNAQARGYNKPSMNSSTGVMNNPPIFTNAITEDAITSDRTNTFTFKATPGDYDIYIVCGLSEASRNQFYDYTVQVGTDKQRVQFEGPYQFRSLKFKAKVTDKNLSVIFTPLNKWAVNAIIAYPVASAEKMKKDILTPFEEWTYRLRPDEWAKWKLEGVLPVVEFTARDADQKRGFVVYTRPYTECIFPQTRPLPEDIDPSLKIFATPGEYEPLNFVVLPLKDLTGAKVTVSAVGPVPANQIDIRYSVYTRARPNFQTAYRYVISPDLLEHFKTLDLTSGENTRFWLTVHVPGNAPAGTYKSKITFECSGGKTEIPVELQILPFKLREDPGKVFGIYYRFPIDQATGADQVSAAYYKNKNEMEFADMVAHGTRNVTMSCGGQAADAQGNFNFNWDVFSQKMALWKKYGFVGPIVMSISTQPVYRKYMNESYGSHLLNIKIPPAEFSTELTNMVKAIETERKKQGWPEFLYYPVDEPGRDSTSIKFMTIVLKACKAAGVRTYITASPVTPAFQPLRPYVDVWCTQPFSPDRETVLKEMKENHIEFWCYPNHVNGENDKTPVTGARMTYGFGFWRSGFVHLIPWMYSAAGGDRFNNLDGSQTDFFNHFEPDGTPIPCALWEAYREGYDDYRYIYTLEQTIAEGKNSTKQAAQQKATAAETALKSVWDAIKVLPRYKTNEGLWAPAEFDKYRRQIADQIVNVQAALKQ